MARSIPKTPLGDDNQLARFCRFAQNESLLFAMYRTHHCNQLRKADIGEQVTLPAGCMCAATTAASFSSICAIARDLTQVVFRPEENAELPKQAHILRQRRCDQVTGTGRAAFARARKIRSCRPAISRWCPTKLEILESRRADLPFPLDDEFTTKICG